MRDLQIHQTAMVNNNDNCNDLSHELEDQGILDLQRNLQNAAINEMNNVVFGEDVANENMSDLDKNYEGGRTT